MRWPLAEVEEGQQENGYPPGVAGCRGQLGLAQEGRWVGEGSLNFLVQESDVSRGEAEREWKSPWNGRLLKPNRIILMVSKIIQKISQTKKLHSTNQTHYLQGNIQNQTEQI